MHLPLYGGAHTTLAWWCAYTTAIIGTSLNEPHTTVTSLNTCLYMRISCFLDILFTFIFVRTLKTPEHTSTNLIAALYGDPDAHVWTDTETMNCGLFQTHMTLTISFYG